MANASDRFFDGLDGGSVSIDRRINLGVVIVRTKWGAETTTEVNFTPGDARKIAQALLSTADYCEHNPSIA